MAWIKGEGHAYTRDDAFKGVWKKILRLAGNDKKIKAIPTKTNPSGKASKTINLKVPQAQVKIEQITIDDISSFKRVKKLKSSKVSAKIPETAFKKGLLKIIGETGAPPKDWGGEKNDVYTTRLALDSKRFHAAFALKGPGQKVKKLTPRHMGKNGDQIPRLANSSVQIFIVQYWGEIDQAVVDLMLQLAVAKSYTEGRKIYFGIIDGSDSSRLMEAYPKAFK